MPRLAPSLLHHARRKNSLLPLLLRECRDTRSAENELRWLTEHAFAIQSSPHARTETVRRSTSGSTPGWRTTLRKLVRRRARGEPLQYILGTQPFGDLEILCQRGVLIPRPETETYTAKLAELVRVWGREETSAKRQKLRILDLCTGTGCISLLLHSLLRPSNGEGVGASNGQNQSFLNLDLDILGMDISEPALRLAKNNLQHNVEHGNLHLSAEDNVAFVQANVLDKSIKNLTDGKDSPPDTKHETFDAGPEVRVPSAWKLLQREDLSTGWDILVANPPYISPRQFSPGGTTARSVRRWEPQLALVPSPMQSPDSQHVARTERESQLERGDEFYPHLLELAKSVEAKVVVLEVGDGLQALRVRQIAAQCFAGEPDIALEVWRDDGAVHRGTSDCGRNVPGNDCRAVVVWRSSWAKWRMRTENAQKQRS